ncbi:MAG: LytTR family DNA-binding domain-containing protein [Desulfobacteraceae bacterium]|jgi:two-component system LytT family response regulator
MKIVILEDEAPAAKRLINQLNKIDPGTEIITVLESVDEAVKWFRKNEKPELAFLDVQLADGTCFDIFEETDPGCPIIFVTAYDEYALKAFKLNSIDYLLKPVDPEELEQSLKKFNDLRNQYQKSSSINELEALLKDFRSIRKEYKKRFLIKTGDSYHYVQCTDIAYFYIEDQLVHITTHTGKTHVIDNSLDDLEKDLDPGEFNRINRQMILSAGSIRSIHRWFNSRLKVELVPSFSKDVIVSREKVKDFKAWLDR